MTRLTAAQFKIEPDSGEDFHRPFTDAEIEAHPDGARIRATLDLVAVAVKEKYQSSINNKFNSLFGHKGTIR